MAQKKKKAKTCLKNILKNRLQEPRRPNAENTGPMPVVRLLSVRWPTGVLKKVGNIGKLLVLH